MAKHLNGIGFGLFVMFQAAGFAGAAADRGDQPGAASTTQPAKPVHAGIQLRDPMADRHLIDLTNYYTLALTEDASGALGYTLDALPTGVKQLGTVQYDLRGVVQVSSQQFAGTGKKFPEAVKGIPVGLKCHKLCFLHASRWDEDNRTKIGSYMVHYANGRTWEVPIIYGVDLCDWRSIHDAGADGPVPAWQGHDNAGNEMGLFETAWTNPLPLEEIASIDMVSAMTNAAPFLVAVTAQ